MSKVIIADKKVSIDTEEEATSVAIDFVDSLIATIVGQSRGDALAARMECLCLELRKMRKRGGR